MRLSTTERDGDLYRMCDVCVAGLQSGVVLEAQYWPYMALIVTTAKLNTQTRIYDCETATAVFVECGFAVGSL